MFRNIRKKLLEGSALRVVFLNDTGFIGGAGIGLRRQVQCFLDAGHSVAVVCWLSNPLPDPLPPRGRAASGQWMRMHSLPRLCHDQGLSDEAICSGVIEKAMSLSPDLVISGNLHWARWPLKILAELHDRKVPTVAYLHDCHWLTGRCAYTGNCRKYLDSCDHTCPTSSEYPPAHPEAIQEAWHQRREVFVGKRFIPLIGNSKWICDIASDAFHHQAVVKLAPLGLDTSLFSPIDRSLARRLLHLPAHGVLIVAGAVNLKEPRKGGPLLEWVIQNVHERTAARVITFGALSDQFKGVISLGIIQDERMMPWIYSAADIMMHTAHEESFGQTLMEASACGIPVVSMKAGGMVEIARGGSNALNVPQNDPAAYFRAVQSLVESPDLRTRMGSTGRAIVEEEYSLTAQYGRWKKTLMEL